MYSTHHVPETDGGQGDEAVVDWVEVAPALVPGEGRRPAGYRQGAEGGDHTDEIQFGGRRLTTVQGRLHGFYYHAVKLSVRVIFVSGGRYSDERQLQET